MTRTPRRLAMLLGESPSATSDPARPLEGRCGDRLLEMAGWPTGYDELIARFEVANVLPYYPGPSFDGRGTRWPAATARAHALELDLPPVVVVLGRRVAAALGAPLLPWHEPRRVRGRTLLLVPHPSGRNRRLNAPAERAYTGNALREAHRLAAQDAARR